MSNYDFPLDSADHSRDEALSAFDKARRSTRGSTAHLSYLAEATALFAAANVLEAREKEREELKAPTPAKAPARRRTAAKTPSPATPTPAPAKGAGK